MVIIKVDDIQQGWDTTTRLMHYQTSKIKKGERWIQSRENKEQGWNRRDSTNTELTYKKKNFLSERGAPLWF